MQGLVIYPNKLYDKNIYYTNIHLMDEFQN